MFSQSTATSEIQIEKTIDVLSIEAKDSAYNLSVVVLASAQHHDKERYKQGLPTLLNVLAKIPEDSFKAWMLSRVVLAAKHIEDKETASQYLPILKKLLGSLKTDKRSAWAWGYLAAVDGDEYKTAKKDMLEAASVLTTHYLTLKMKAAEAKTEMEEALSDVLWSHVMNLQAAARVADNETYQHILEQMKKVTEKSSIKEALSDIPASDWQAWAMGIVKLAAATIHDKSLYQELEEPLKEAILAAQKTNSKANAMLAYLNETQGCSLIEKASLRLS